jgi:hypothetical protein
MRPNSPLIFERRQTFNSDGCRALLGESSTLATRFGIANQRRDAPSVCRLTGMVNPYSSPHASLCDHDNFEPHAAEFHFPDFRALGVISGGSRDAWLMHGI